MPRTKYHVRVFRAILEACEDTSSGQNNPIAVLSNAQGCVAAIWAARLEAGGGSATLIFFILPLFSLLWALIFVSGLQTFSCILHFVIVLSLILILLIYICVDFNAF
jgi:hypothetical protein